MNEMKRSLDDYLEKLRIIFPTVREQYGVLSLEVFGSYVRGEEGVDSDLNLLITFYETPTLFRFIELENFISDSIGIKVDLVMKESLKPGIGTRDIFV